MLPNLNKQFFSNLLYHLSDILQIPLQQIPSFHNKLLHKVICLVQQLFQLRIIYSQLFILIHYINLSLISDSLAADFIISITVSAISAFLINSPLFSSKSSNRIFCIRTHSSNLSISFFAFSICQSASLQASRLKITRLARKSCCSSRSMFSFCNKSIFISSSSAFFLRCSYRQFSCDTLYSAIVKS